ncbi:dTDP-glucose 4,6-dehydratase [Phaeospirillum tilakii]|uniref:dTDP-glucose 4,6-dehydratase n=1 Tax=Phaeospirillum tilakii TaxID=741673 RepID=A0ABW5CAQ8_9PROT
MSILVTGGAGFIGSAVCHHLLDHTDDRVVCLDKLTYAANPATLDALRPHPRFAFVQADICDGGAVAAILAAHRPGLILHLAAETHVDRSIAGPAAFVQSNLVGTAMLLAAALEYWRGLAPAEQAAFRFLHVSTDEVYGSLGAEGRFREDSPYAPNSPYSASKAGADHLARAWFHTYGLPVLISNCSNNYGPRQFPEKLIPLMIVNALAGKPLPVYGQGANVRDWLYVEDHAAALLAIARRGRPGEKYNVGGRAERSNLAVVHTLCRLLDDSLPDSPHRPHAGLIRHVTDRPGHDFRYAIDGGKIERELGWTPSVDFDTGLARTLRWYLDHRDWWRTALTRAG